MTLSQRALVWLFRGIVLWVVAEAEPTSARGAGQKLLVRTSGAFLV